METKKNKQNFISHFLAIGLGTVINMILGLITTPIITRLVDPTEYGQLSIFNTYSNIAYLVLCVGLDQALVRFFYDKEDLSYRQSLFRFCFLIPLIISTLISVGVSIISFCNTGLFEFKPIIMVFLCLNVIVCIWNRFSMLLLRLDYKSRRYAFCNVLHRSVYIILALLFIFLINDDYLFFLVVATVVSLAVSSLVATFFTKDYWTFKAVPKLENKKAIIRYGLPFILSVAITTIFQACDQIALNYFGTYEDVGIYSSASTIVNVFALIQTSFTAVWSPMMIEHIETKPEDKAFIQRVNKYITIVMFVIGLLLILGKDLFALILGEKYRQAAYVIPFLIFNPIMYTISETTQPGIEYSKKSYFNIIIALVACLFNIVGNYFLVPLYGCRGAAISTGISYIVFFAMRTLVSNKYYYINYGLWKFCIITLFTIAYAFYNTFFSFDWISIVGFFVCIGVLLALYWNDTVDLIKVLHRQLKDIVHKKQKTDK
jgi:O-antigen/teichoic acid export membrane protein